MAFHINPSTGNPGQCTAKVKPCPFGSANEHYATKEQAREVYEKLMEKIHSDKTVPSFLMQRTAADHAKRGEKVEAADMWTGDYVDVVLINNTTGPTKALGQVFAVRLQAPPGSASTAVMYVTEVAGEYTVIDDFHSDASVARPEDAAIEAYDSWSGTSLKARVLENLPTGEAFVEVALDDGTFSLSSATYDSEAKEWHLQD